MVGIDWLLLSPQETPMSDALLVALAIGIGVAYAFLIGDDTPYEPLMRFTTTTIGMSA